MSLERDKNPPALHVVASLLVPIFDAVYQLDRTEYQHFIEWINGLAISGLA